MVMFHQDIVSCGVGANVTAMTQYQVVRSQFDIPPTACGISADFSLVVQTDSVSFTNINPASPASPRYTADRDLCIILHC
jgi:hypothetical protein